MKYLLDMKKIIITESQFKRMRENVLLERVCPQGLSYDEKISGCVKVEELPEVTILGFKNDPTGEIAEAYKQYQENYFKLEQLYKLNDLTLGDELKYNSEKDTASIELFKNLNEKVKKKYKEEYDEFETVRRKRFVDEEVRPMIDKPYVWGKAGPEFFDCSGLICAVFEQGRDTADGYFNTADIFTDISKVKVGDIVFFDYDPDNVYDEINNPDGDKKPIDHVGIISQVEGKRIKIIHASGDQNCTYESFKEGKLPNKCKVKEVNYGPYWKRNTKGFGRFVGFEY